MTFKKLFDKIEEISIIGLSSQEGVNIPFNVYYKLRKEWIEKDEGEKIDTLTTTFNEQTGELKVSIIDSLDNLTEEQLQIDKGFYVWDNHAGYTIQDLNNQLFKFGLTIQTYERANDLGRLWYKIVSVRLIKN